MIIGGPGSGKSTLARAPGTRTGLPGIHIGPPDGALHPTSGAEIAAFLARVRA